MLSWRGPADARREARGHSHGRRLDCERWRPLDQALGDRGQKQIDLRVERASGQKTSSARLPSFRDSLARSRRKLPVRCWAHGLWVLPGPHTQKGSSKAEETHTQAMIVTGQHGEGSVLGPRGHAVMAWLRVYAAAEERERAAALKKAGDLFAAGVGVSSLFVDVLAEGSK